MTAFMPQPLAGGAGRGLVFVAGLGWGYDRHQAPTHVSQAIHRQQPTRGGVGGGRARRRFARNQNQAGSQAILAGAGWYAR